MINRTLWGHILSVAPETSSMEGGACFHLDTSHNRPDPFVARCDHTAPEACEVDDTTAQITLHVRSTQTSAPCPLCATPARRIHSDYGRTLADLPWAHYRVRLQLRVRKWFCGNRRGHRRIFTERLPTVAAPWARRTLRLAHRLGALGVALGQPGSLATSGTW